VHGTTLDSPSVPSAFASQLTVALLALGKPMGTLSLFSHQVNAYSAEDGELLDILANQTADAILALRAAESESQRQIERMVESMADGVLLIDPNDQPVVINPAARRMLRLLDGSGEEITRQIRQTLGFHPFEWISGSEYSGARMLRDEMHVEGRTLQFALTPVSDSRGTVKGVCIVLRDITEQKQLEERKEEFVSIVSHELRTPLTSISGALDLILNFMVGDVTEKQQRYLSLAKESADKLNSIVDDLLDLSKFAKGRLKMSFELVALDALLKAAVERYAPTVMEKKIRVDLQLPDKPVRVLADPDRMTQVFHNLFTNAVKFTPDGGDIVIRLGTSPHLPGFVCLACYNSGEGIPEEDLERVFDKFEQARSERTRTVRGTGLGLPISRNIVDAHGGQIWAEENRSGAELVMVLPVKPPDERLESEGFDPSAQKTAPLRGTVLVRLDDVQLSYLLKGVLGSRGYKVIATADVDAALEKGAKARPDIAFVDIASAEQLSLAEAPPWPMVIISDLLDRARAFELGAAAFLKRPLLVDQLFATADSLLKGLSRPKRGRVVVIDDDEQVIALCREVLPNLGFQVLAASSIQSGRALLQERRADLLLLNLALEDERARELLEELEVERAAGCISVIGISTRREGSAKGRAFVSGVDDFLVKPFDAEDLVANVQSVVRAREMEGAGAIEAEVKRRLELGFPFAFCYLELDGLKAYGDYYGFAKADGVVKQAGNLLSEVVAQVGGAGDFLGHVAGSSFVLVADPDRLDAICRRATLAFNRVIPLYYEKEDRERGYIEVDDRRGRKEKSKIIGLSIVAVISDGRTATHVELARQLAELKRQAKAEGGSSYWRSDRQWPIRWNLESITGS
jgi:signal transduction histidine kinase/DNA-binding response OmpR family regulator